jgi:hypothetical protein
MTIIWDITTRYGKAVLFEERIKSNTYNISDDKIDELVKQSNAIIEKVGLYQAIKSHELKKLGGYAHFCPWIRIKLYRLERPWWWN